MQQKNSVGWASFLQLCHHAKSTKKIDDLFQLLLTPEERDQLADRVLLVEALIKNEKTQRQIAAELNISIAKITRGSNQLKSTSDEIKKYFLQTLK